MGEQGVSCYFSTGAFLSSDLPEILDVCIQHDLDVELSSAVTYAPDLLSCLNLVEGKIDFLVHNYFPPPLNAFVLNLAAIDPEVHAASVALCRSAIDLCSFLEAPFYSVHAGFGFHLAPHELGDPRAQQELSPERLIPRDAAMEQFVRSIRELLDYADVRGVGLLVENNVLARENLLDDGQSPLLLADIEEIRAFFRELNDPRIGLLLDAGHAKVTATTRDIPVEGFIRELQPLIRGMHLSDNDGFRDTNQPFDESVWFAPFLKELSTVPKVIEVNRLSVDEMFRHKQIVATLLS